MQHENNRPNEPADAKAAPPNVAGKNEAQAKQKTDPLERTDNEQIDQYEGKMNNGEIGGHMGKDDASS